MEKRMIQTAVEALDVVEFSKIKKAAGGQYGGSETMGIQAPAEVKYSLIHEAIRQDDNLLNISSLCVIAGVSRSGYYAWLEAAPLRQCREETDRTDFAQVKQAYEFRGYKKGARSIYMRLLHLEPHAGGHGSQENPPFDEEIRSFLPDPAGKSLSPNGKGDEDEPCGKQ